MLTLLHAIFPLLKIVALSGQPESGQTARQAGVDAFISKVDPPERLLNTLRAMHTKLE
jgi:CheY-like chemotaxis protein